MAGLWSVCLANVLVCSCKKLSVWNWRSEGITTNTHVSSRVGHSFMHTTLPQYRYLACLVVLHRTIFHWWPLHTEGLFIRPWWFWNTLLSDALRPLCLFDEPCFPCVLLETGLCQVMVMASSTWHHLARLSRQLASSRCRDEVWDEDTHGVQSPKGAYVRTYS